MQPRPVDSSLGGQRASRVHSLGNRPFRCVHPSSTSPRCLPAAVNITKIAVGDSPTQVFLKNDIVENRSEPSVVSPSRRRGKPDVEARPQIVVDLSIGRCQGMVSLIGDNHVEVAGFKLLLESIYERLDRSRDDLLAMRAALGLFYADRAAVSI